MRVGDSLLGIASLHSAVGTGLYWPEIRAACAEGLLATVPDRGDRAAAFWFLISGVAFFALGLVVRELEREGLPLPRALSPALVALTAAIVVPMPVSGGWLFLPVAWCAWRRARRSELALAVR
jgi:Family of unknown function (DUF6463)